MKKIAALCLILAGAGALFAQNIKVGGGAHFTANFDTYSLTKEATDAGVEEQYSHTHLIGGGIFAFLDVTYLKFDAGLLFGNFNQDKYENDPTDYEKKGRDITALKIGLFGKVPIAMGAFTLFPMLGLDGQIFLAGKDNDGDLEYTERAMGREAFNQLWIKTGVGLDIPLAAEGKVFLRPEFLYGIRFNTDAEREELDNSDTRGISAIVGHGLDLKLAIGYSF